MRYYEISILISPDLSEKELDALKEKVFSFIQEEQGILVKNSDPVQKTLGYPIKKKQQAFFLTIDFQLNPESLEKIKNKLKKESEILRFLLLNKKTSRTKETETKRPRTFHQPAKTKVELKEIEEKLEEILTE